MRGALGVLSRALVVGLVAAGVALIAHLYLDGLLSRERLDSAFANLVRYAGTATWSLMRSRQVYEGLAILAAFLAGWVAALRWIEHRIRRRPLIIADLRHGDMSLAEGIRHIRSHTFPPVSDDAAAIGVILHEASYGRLTLWRQASADTLWRIPTRQVRTLNRRMITISNLSLSLESWGRFMLLAEEVEQLWPSRPSLSTALVTRELKKGATRVIFPDDAS